MLRDILVQTFDDHGGVDVVGSVTGPADAVLDAACDTEAAVVLTFQTNIQTSAGFARLLRDRPALKVFEIADDGRALHLLELRPVCRSFGHLPPDAIAERIRAAMVPQAPLILPAEGS